MINREQDGAPVSPCLPSCVEESEEKGTMSKVFHNLLPLAFWEVAKPKADGHKEVTSEIPGLPHGLEVARRVSGNSEERERAARVQLFHGPR